jgi:threonine dehydratase
VYDLINWEQLEEARSRLVPYLRPTPLIYSFCLSERLGRPVWLKVETQQPTGSFKIRPAFHNLLVHLPEARQRGVLTSSSGNFAQAIAYAAKQLGVQAHIVMMSTASAYKRERARALGAQITVCGDTFADRWQTTYRLLQETGSLFVHPYDSEETIVGNGTIGLELLHQLRRNFALYVPVSGGGLLAGIAGALKRARPAISLWGVQPQANGSMARSLEAGHPVDVGQVSTVADALSVAQPGERTFALAQSLVEGIHLVDEEQILEAVHFLSEDQKLLVEPGGAVGVACLLAGYLPPGSGDIVCILSGGNLSPPAPQRKTSLAPEQMTSC